MTEYYIFNNGVQVGPYTIEQLSKLLAGGKITGESIIKISGGPQDGHFTNVGKLLEKQPVASSDRKIAKILSSNQNSLRVACPVCNQHYNIPESMMKHDKFVCVKCDNDFFLPSRQTSAPETVMSNESTFGLDSEIPEGDCLCPHCWKSFERDYILYIAVHPSLFGDPILGEYAQKRFVPTVFNQSGQPLDPCGLPATEMACPRCHLRIPAGLLETRALYFSIAGATSSGKSYFLTCLTHQLRKTLPEYFGAAFFDADPRLNETLNSYEKQLFMPLRPQEITALPATQISGEGISDRVRLDNIEIELPKPFVFEFRGKESEENLNMVFYDNSGEMFIPGRDEWVNQATFHLSHSNGIMFVFDPTNDAAMRLNICNDQDPQVSKNPRISDQTVLLNEMISRIRRHSNIMNSETCQIPLVIVVGKYDTWKEHFEEDVCAAPYISRTQGAPDGFEEYSLNRQNILRTSYALRNLMLKYVPGLVNAAEGFFETVYFVPISNFGTLAEQSQDGAIGIVPGKINPIWVDVPLLTLLAENKQISFDEKTDITKPLLGKIVNDRIIFTDPDTGKIARLPLCYADAELKIAGKVYRLPSKKQCRTQ